jgi:uncharacterized membrane protein
MISIDVMEVLLRSIPQYFLFGALAFFIFSYMNKKPLYSLVGEVILVVVGVIMLIVFMAGYIPSPKTAGMNEEHLKLVFNMVLFFLTIGLLSTISLLIRLFRKKQFVPLVVAIFVLSIVLFFQSTKLSRVKFELNPPSATVTDSLK